MSVPQWIPQEFEWAYTLVAGQSWPQGDEDGLRACASAWTDALTGLLDVADDGNNTARDVHQSVQAMSAAEFAAYWQKWVGGDDSWLGQLAQQCSGCAASLLGQAEETECTKLTINISIVIMAIQLAWLVFSAIFTEGLSLAEAPMVLFVARESVLMGVARFIEQVAAAVVPDVITQAIMISEGHQDGWDWSRTGMAALPGVAGALAGTFGGKLLGQVLPVMAQPAETWGDKALQTAVHSVEGGLTNTLIGGGMSAYSYLTADPDTKAWIDAHGGWARGLGSQFINGAAMGAMFSLPHAISPYHGEVTSLTLDDGSTIHGYAHDGGLTLFNDQGFRVGSGDFNSTGDKFDYTTLSGVNHSVSLTDRTFSVADHGVTTHYTYDATEGGRKVVSHTEPLTTPMIVIVGGAEETLPANSLVTYNENDQLTRAEVTTGATTRVYKAELPGGELTLTGRQEGVAFGGARLYAADGSLVATRNGWTGHTAVVDQQAYADAFGDGVKPAGQAMSDVNAKRQLADFLQRLEAHTSHGDELIRQLESGDFAAMTTESSTYQQIAAMYADHLDGYQSPGDPPNAPPRDQARASIDRLLRMISGDSKLRVSGDPVLDEAVASLRSKAQELANALQASGTTPSDAVLRALRRAQGLLELHRMAMLRTSKVLDLASVTETIGDAVSILNGQPFVDSTEVSAIVTYGANEFELTWDRRESFGVVRLENMRVSLRDGQGGMQLDDALDLGLIDAADLPRNTSVLVGDLRRIVASLPPEQGRKPAQPIQIDVNDSSFVNDVTGVVDTRRLFPAEYMQLTPAERFEAEIREHLALEQVAAGGPASKMWTEAMKRLADRRVDLVDSGLPPDVLKRFQAAADLYGWSDSTRDAVTRAMDGEARNIAAALRYRSREIEVDRRRELAAATAKFTGDDDKLADASSTINEKYDRELNVLKGLSQKLIEATARTRQQMASKPGAAGDLTPYLKPGETVSDVFDLRTHVVEPTWNADRGVTAPGQPYRNARVRQEIDFSAVQTVNADGEAGTTYLIAHIALRPDSNVPKDLIELMHARANLGMELIYNGPMRAASRDGMPPVEFRVEFVAVDPADPSRTVNLGLGDRRANQTQWHVTDSVGTISHEIGHFFGLPDRYFDKELRTPGRTSPTAIGIRDRAETTLMSTSKRAGVALDGRDLAQIMRYVRRAQAGRMFDDLIPGWDAAPGSGVFRKFLDAALLGREADGAKAAMKALRQHFGDLKNPRPSPGSGERMVAPALTLAREIGWMTERIPRYARGIDFSDPALAGDLKQASALFQRNEPLRRLSDVVDEYSKAYGSGSVADQAAAQNSIDALVHDLAQTAAGLKSARLLMDRHATLSASADAQDAARMLNDHNATNPSDALPAEVTGRVDQLITQLDRLQNAVGMAESAGSEAAALTGRAQQAIQRIQVELGLLGTTTAPPDRALAARNIISSLSEYVALHAARIDDVLTNAGAAGSTSTAGAAAAPTPPVTPPGPPVTPPGPTVSQPYYDAPAMLDAPDPTGGDPDMVEAHLSSLAIQLSMAPDRLVKALATISPLQAYDLFTGLDTAQSSLDRLRMYLPDYSPDEVTDHIVGIEAALHAIDAVVGDQPFDRATVKPSVSNAIEATVSSELFGRETVPKSDGGTASIDQQLADALARLDSLPGKLSKALGELPSERGFLLTQKLTNAQAEFDRLQTYLSDYPAEDAGRQLDRIENAIQEVESGIGQPLANGELDQVTATAAKTLDTPVLGQDPHALQTALHANPAPIEPGAAEAAAQAPGPSSTPAVDLSEARRSLVELLLGQAQVQQQNVAPPVPPPDLPDVLEARKSLVELLLGQAQARQQAATPDPSSNVHSPVAAKLAESDGDSSPSIVVVTEPANSADNPIVVDGGLFGPTPMASTAARVMSTVAWLAQAMHGVHLPPIDVDTLALGLHRASDRNPLARALATVLLAPGYEPIAPDHALVRFLMAHDGRVRELSDQAKGFPKLWDYGPEQAFRTLQWLVQGIQPDGDPADYNAIEAARHWIGGMLTQPIANLASGAAPTGITYDQVIKPVWVQHNGVTRQYVMVGDRNLKSVSGSSPTSLFSVDMPSHQLPLTPGGGAGHFGDGLSWASEFGKVKASISIGSGRQVTVDFRDFARVTLVPIGPGRVLRFENPGEAAAPVTTYDTSLTVKQTVGWGKVKTPAPHGIVGAPTPYVAAQHSSSTVWRWQHEFEANPRTLMTDMLVRWPQASLSERLEIQLATGLSFTALGESATPELSITPQLVKNLASWRRDIPRGEAELYATDQLRQLLEMLM